LLGLRFKFIGSGNLTGMSMDRLELSEAIEKSLELESQIPELVAQIKQYPF